MPYDGNVALEPVSARWHHAGSASTPRAAPSAETWLARQGSIALKSECLLRWQGVARSIPFSDFTERSSGAASTTWLSGHSLP